MPTDQPLGPEWRKALEVASSADVLRRATESVRLMSGDDALRRAMESVRPLAGDDALRRATESLRVASSQDVLRRATENLTVTFNHEAVLRRATENLRITLSHEDVLRRAMESVRRLSGDDALRRATENLRITLSQEDVLQRAAEWAAAAREFDSDLQAAQEDDAEDRARSLAWWLATRSLTSQVALLHGALGVLYAFNYLVEQATGEDIPDTLQAATMFALEVMAFLVIYLGERYKDDDDS